MTLRKALAARQRRWAEAAGIHVDAAGFVASADANLRVPLTSAARAAFERGSELAPRAAAPPRMHAVYSSAALVANVFDYWFERDCAPLVAALGFPPQAARLTFEAPFPTGLDGDPALLDVLLELADGGLLAIESKFGEWLTPRPRNKRGFKPKYFPPGRRLWAERGLGACQALAEDLQLGSERYKHLHPAQFLKQALALAVHGACGLAARAVPARAAGVGRATLVYLYYDWPGPTAKAHAAEIERFARRVGGELPFAAVTYQQLFRNLTASSGADGGYLAYLRARYFGIPAPA